MTNIIPTARNGTPPMRAARPAPPPDPALAAILGAPPILASEDAEAYAALQERMRATIVPADIIEEIWVRDVVDLIWETLRLRRLRAKLLTTERQEALHTVLAGVMDRARRDATIPRWARGMRKARKDVDRALAGAGLDDAAVDAVALSERLDTFERIERMIMQVEARRNAVLREVDRHRETLGQQLRSLAEDCIELAVERPALALGAAAEPAAAPALAIERRELAASRPAIAVERTAAATERKTIPVARPAGRSPVLGWDHGDDD